MTPARNWGLPFGPSSISLEIKYIRICLQCLNINMISVDQIKVNGQFLFSKNMFSLF